MKWKICFGKPLWVFWTECPDNPTCKYFKEKKYHTPTDVGENKLNGGNYNGNYKRFETNKENC